MGDHNGWLRTQDSLVVYPTYHAAFLTYHAAFLISPPPPPAPSVVRMYGFFQTAFYFTYMGLFSSVLGIMCGTIGYLGTSHFVHKIYSTVKID